MGIGRHSGSDIDSHRPARPHRPGHWRGRSDSVVAAMPASKPGVKNSWQFVEQHGLWWAYEGDMPSPEAFRTHGRPHHLPILGPYPSREVAEALLLRRLDRRGAVQFGR